MVTVAPELASATLVLARVAGLFAAVPVLGDGAAPRRVRLGLVVVTTALLTPMAAGAAPAPVALEALAFAAALELAFGLVVAMTARFALAAAEIAGQLMSLGVGLHFAAQYDTQRGADDDAVVGLSRAVAGLAFLGAGGLDALIYAAAAPALPSGNAAQPADTLQHAALAALDLGTSAVSYGLGLAAPIVLAGLVGNLALAIAHRAVPAASLFAVGFSAVLLLGGAAAMSSADALVTGLGELAERAVAAFGVPFAEAP